MATRASSAANVVRVARERRPSGRWIASRSSPSAAWISLAQRARTSSRQVAGAVEHHRDPEQPLDHALVHLAREVDPLPQLARGLRLRGDVARDRGQRRRLAERPQQVALGGVERRLVEAALGDDHADGAPGRDHRATDHAHRLRARSACTRRAAARARRPRSRRPDPRGSPAPRTAACRPRAARRRSPRCRCRGRRRRAPGGWPGRSGR